MPEPMPRPGPPPPRPAGPSGGRGSYPGLPRVSSGIWRGSRSMPSLASRGSLYWQHVRIAAFLSAHPPLERAGGGTPGGQSGRGSGGAAGRPTPAAKAAVSRPRAGAGRGRGRRPRRKPNSWADKWGGMRLLPLARLGPPPAAMAGRGRVPDMCIAPAGRVVTGRGRKGPHGRGGKADAVGDPPGQVQGKRPNAI